VVADPIAHWAAKYPERPAVIDDRPGEPVRQVSYEELDRLADGLADELRSRGVGVDDRVLWCGPNSLEVLVITHATRRLGAVVVPLPYRLTPPEAAFIVEHSAPTVALVDDDYRTLIPDGAISHVLSYDMIGPAASAVEHIDAELTKAIIYTSGTTGQPKGAVRSTRATPGQFGALLEMLGWRDHHVVFLTTGPLYHSGPGGFANRAAVVGATIVVQAHFDAADWLRLVDAYGVTATFAAPTPIKRVCELPQEVRARYDVSSMRSMVANAAPWTMALKRSYLDCFPVESLWEVYGSTELSVCTVLEPQDQLSRPGSCGRAAPGVEVALFSDSGERITEPGEPGNLYVKSPGVFETYLDADEAAAADNHEGFQTVGDIAYFDADGYCYICDRKKDVIISGGANVYPAEVENVLDEHAAIRDVAVVGEPDAEWGEAVCAWVVLQPDMGASEEELIAYARERLAGYKTPKRVRFIADLPRTGSGKVLKRELRELAQ
jgi:acyl-CoA synthetase (AMP-forming)/AMP-acid ligase II